MSANRVIAVFDPRVATLPFLDFTADRRHPPGLRRTPICGLHRILLIDEDPDFEGRELRLNGERVALSAADAALIRRVEASVAAAGEIAIAVYRLVPEGAVKRSA